MKEKKLLDSRIEYRNWKLQIKNLILQIYNSQINFQVLINLISGSNHEYIQFETSI